MPNPEHRFQIARGKYRNICTNDAKAKRCAAQRRHIGAIHANPDKADALKHLSCRRHCAHPSMLQSAQAPPPDAGLKRHSHERHYNECFSTDKTAPRAQLLLPLRPLINHQ
jgi:hypothetical protein